MEYSLNSTSNFPGMEKELKKEHGTQQVKQVKNSFSVIVEGNIRDLEVSIAEFFKYRN